MSSPDHDAAIVAHADWSVDPRKRWVAMARREHEVWRLAAPVPVGAVATFLTRLRTAANGGAVALIIVGALFLLNTLEIIELHQILRFWPVLLILAGVNMLHSRMSDAGGPRGES